MRASVVLVRMALTAALMLGAVGLARAGEAAPSADDAVKIRAIISAQMEAFKKDDAPAAFGFASPKIQEIFRDPDTFMGMVREGYQPVYRPRQVQFGVLEAGANGPIQHVQVVGPDGVAVDALYFMEKESDGNWRINGCQLQKSVSA